MARTFVTSTGIPPVREAPSPPQLAAETAEAASAQGKFTWQMHAYLFQAQNDFDRDHLSAACGLLGLDYVRLDRDISGQCAS